MGQVCTCHKSGNNTTHKYRHTTLFQPSNHAEVDVVYVTSYHRERGTFRNPAVMAWTCTMKLFTPHTHLYVWVFEINRSSSLKKQLLTLILKSQRDYEWSQGKSADVRSCPNRLKQLLGDMIPCPVECDTVRSSHDFCFQHLNLKGSGLNNQHYFFFITDLNVSYVYLCDMCIYICVCPVVNEP